MKGNPPAEWSLVYNSDHAANYQVTDGHGAPVPEVERFLHRVGLRGLAPGSLRTYAHDLLCAFRWLATEALAPSAIGAEALLRFVDYQRSRLGAAPTTINRRLQTLQRFVAFLKGEPCTQHPTWWRSPFRARAHSTRISVKEPQTLVVPLTEHEVRAFLESLRTARDRAIAALMGGCNGERYQLAHDALTATADGHFALRVPPVKTYRERLIPLASETVELLEAIRRQRGQRRAPPPPTAAYLMVNEWGRHLQPKVYAEALKRWTQHLCSESIHPHRLRHTFATQMARAGMSLQALMKILGHRKPQMSLQYIALSGTDLQLAYEQALATLKTLNAVQPKLPPSFTATTPTTFDELFQTLIRQLETLRRDARHNTPLAENSNASSSASARLATTSPPS